MIIDILVIISFCVHVIFLWKYRKFFTSNWINMSLLMISILASLLFYITTFLMVHSFIYICLNGFTEVVIWKVRLWQVEYTIDSFLKRQYPPITYVMFIYKKTIQYIFNINPIYGEVFLVYLITNLPVNALFVMDLILGVGSLFFRVIAAIVINTQILVIFLIHILIANRNSQLNFQSKLILKLPFHYRFYPNIKFRLNLFIQAFHSKRKYGITYGRFGLVTLFAFSKVCHPIRN